MYAAAPALGERFYLRLLLTAVRGAIGFESLRTIDGVVHPTFHQACIALGLLEDDGEWRLCLREAAGLQTGWTLRQLFTSILLHCHPTHPEALWNEFCASICDDLARTLIWRRLHQAPTQEEVYDYGLHLIEELICQAGRDMA